MKTNLMEINFASAMSADLPVGYVEQRVSEITEISRDLIDDIHLSNLIDLHSGDFTKRICFKSGTLLEQRQRQHITQAFAVYGEDDAIALLQRENIANCALHWVHTSPEALDKLMLHDPYGYAVYAMSYVLANHSPIDRTMRLRRFTSKPKANDPFYSEYKQAEFYWVLQKHELSKRLLNYNYAEIVELNERLRIYLTVFEAIQLPNKYDCFANLLVADADVEFTEILPAAGHNLQAFIRLMNETLWAVLRDEENAGRISYKENYDQLYRIREKYHGYSNFAGQKRPRGQSDTDAIGAIMRDEMRKAGITDITIRAMENPNLQVFNNRLVSVPEGHVIGRKQLVTATNKPKFGFAKPKPVIEQILATVSENQ